MSIVIISDLHLESTDNIKVETLKNFFEHELVKSSQGIYFLGDVFDMVIGNHIQYIFEYKFFFDKICELLKEGKTVKFFEGNHDFHLNNLFNSHFKRNNIDSENFKYFKKPQVEKLWNNKYYFGHGDELSNGNNSYLFYRKVIRSRFVELIANYILSHKSVLAIGQTLKRNIGNEEKYEELEKNKMLFRKIIKKNLGNKSLDFVIVGHSHSIDDYNIDDKCRYINIGAAEKDRTFLYIDDNQIKHIKIN